MQTRERAVTTAASVRNKTVLQVRVDNHLREQVQELYDQIGLDIPTAVRMFFVQSLAYRGIPFSIREPNYETKLAVQEARDIMGGKVRAKSYGSFADFAEDMENEV